MKKCHSSPIMNSDQLYPAVSTEHRNLLNATFQEVFTKTSNSKHTSTSLVPMRGHLGNISDCCYTNTCETVNYEMFVKIHVNSYIWNAHTGRGETGSHTHTLTHTHACETSLPTRTHTHTTTHTLTHAQVKQAHTHTHGPLMLPLYRLFSTSECVFVSNKQDRLLCPFLVA